jgi:cytochrome c553
MSQQKEEYLEQWLESLSEEEKERVTRRARAYMILLSETPLKALGEVYHEEQMRDQ